MKPGLESLQPSKCPKCGRKLLRSVEWKRKGWLLFCESFLDPYLPGAERCLWHKRGK